MSMAPHPSSSGTPRTPEKKDGNFDRWFLKFSNRYSLNLGLPPKTSLEKRRLLAEADPEFSLELSLYSRLQYHYFQGNIEQILSSFDEAAKDVHRKWVKKPLGESDTTPAITHLLRATSEPERREMIRRLNDILTNLHPLKFPSVVSTRTILSPQSRPPPLSPSLDRQRHRAKRRSDERHPSPSLSSFKKVRSAASTTSRYVDEGSEEEGEGIADLESVYPKNRSIFVKKKPSLQPPCHGDSSFYQLSTSANTSKSTFVSTVSKVFEDEEGPPPDTQETQVTVKASTQEKPRRPPPSDLFSDLAPSSSTEFALQTSFSKYEGINGIENNELHRNVGRARAPTSSGAFSDFTIPIEIVEAAEQRPPPAVYPEVSIMPPTQSPSETPRSGKISLEDRLNDSLARLPSSLDEAPLSVRWEILRIALHCSVDLEELGLTYDESWTDQTRLRSMLKSHPSLRDKNFPEGTNTDAWNASLQDFTSCGQHVVLSASLETSRTTTGPFFKVSLNPLKFELPHRLDRRFGSDRFLEILVPSPSRNLSESSADYLIGWLVNHPHILLGRKWTPFFIRKADPKKQARDDGFGPEPKPEYMERVYLFAEDGNEFHQPRGEEYPPKGEPVGSHSRLSRSGLLSWVLQPQKNGSQPYLKLFSRIALNQFRHRDDDILSPTGKVMSDGIARMSSSLARKISKSMGLIDVPAGFQGRIGSAKGFWIRHRTDTDADEDDWIETYPSQRKWKCDFLDPDHRTFEVRSEVRDLTPANLNLQFLPILEDRAIDRDRMKREVGSILEKGLLKELESQRLALDNPIQFRQWLHENGSTSRRSARLKSCEVPFVAGLPKSTEEQMGFLLDGGFDPKKQKFLQDMAWSLRRDKCEELKKRLNIKVGRSTYAFMVVDFLGVLQEDEIHLGFSSRFQDEQSGFSETFLHGFDVLVARSPAHYVSDIQRVKAVFKPELGYLKDVVIFPTKGNTPLADKLSGGDYDGDMAWVCWDPDIVNNFQNEAVPEPPDLFKRGFLSKETTTYGNLQAAGHTGSDLTAEFLRRSFRFNMQQAFLGMCTNWKERLCYMRGSVRDDTAVLLSTLLSNLVDQAKQGIIFTGKDWGRLKRHLLGKKVGEPPVPLYRSEIWDGKGELRHINDYLKFKVAKPTIDRELGSFHEWLNRDSTARHDDEDLFCMFEHLRTLAKESRTFKAVLDGLTRDIHALYKEWERMTGRDWPWEAKVQPIHERFLAIQPAIESSSSSSAASVASSSLSSSSKNRAAASKTIQVLTQPGLLNPALAPWALYKASALFKLYCNRSPKFAWWVAGVQLQSLKAMRASPGVPVPIVSHMYAGLRPDAKYAQAVAAREEGRLGTVADDEEVPRDDDA
ncbi:hypothetical protein DL766_009764 [Monosporascus sp. MC13-8B]|uniref:RNA-dependent RNA polymerase n=1 Tax=Monosporascus cannonballus TaxID=155416 RepID=A0ABY0H456_9PEZI|nr:hypothetical protein DL762_007201 [Monosporascus cannonballus]RYO84568.1 hypothetical protein DL763_007420 [Monosporascus cannonballus]RYP14083.1 hypothetical protein DL766_009764 [Monosporascus sp. MC13-8B]